MGILHFICMSRGPKPLSDHLLFGQNITKEKIFLLLDFTVSEITNLIFTHIYKKKCIVASHVKTITSTVTII